MGVAWWVRPAIEHAQDILFGRLGQEWSINHAFFFGGSLLCSTFRAFLFLFFLFCLGFVIFSKIKSFVLGLFFDFLVFCSFVFRFKSSLQKNDLSSSKLVLIQFGYRGFSFLGHAFRLRSVVFSKLALVSLDYYIILFQSD